MIWYYPSMTTQPVTDRTQLRAVYRQPGPRAAQKVLDHLDRHCQRFIQLSPFCVLSSTDGDGRADASPRGDPPGFVKVLDARTLLIPDRPGNNQVDTLQNVLNHPTVGLLFFVPGMNETLRVCGTAQIITDEELMNNLEVAGRGPQSALKITVKDAFLHCGLALIRSRLWDPTVQIDRTTYPTYGQVLADQITGADAAKIDEDEDKANRDRLY